MSIKAVAPVLLALSALATPVVPAAADSGINISHHCRRVYVVVDPDIQPGFVICP